MVSRVMPHGLDSNGKGSKKGSKKRPAMPNVSFDKLTAFFMQQKCRAIRVHDRSPVSSLQSPVNSSAVKCA